MDNDGNGTVSSSSCPKRTQFALMGAFLGFKDLWLPRVAISYIYRWLLYVLAVFGITLGPMLIVVFGQWPLANWYGSKCLTIILVYCHYSNRQFCGSVHVPNLSRHSQYLMLKSHPNACWLKSLKILDNPFKSLWLPQSPLNSPGSFLPMLRNRTSSVWSNWAECWWEVWTKVTEAFAPPSRYKSWTTRR